jgi:hypothetical protein
MQRLFPKRLSEFDGTNSVCQIDRWKLVPSFFIAASEIGTEVGFEATIPAPYCRASRHYKAEAAPAIK